MDWINGKMVSLSYDRNKKCWVLSMRVDTGENLNKARRLAVRLQGRDTRLGYETKEDLNHE